MNAILSFSFILLVGLLSAKLIGRMKFPSVTAYLVIGILIGPSIFNLISPSLINNSGFISNIVLSFIAFSLGQSFSRESFKRIGRPVLWTSILEACGAWLLTTLSFWLILKQPFYLSLVFGAIASATAPAATLMVVREYRAKGIFTDTLLGVVAIDDAWCLIIFAISLAIARAVHFHMLSALFLVKVVFLSLLEIFGALILGGGIAWAMKRFSRYIRTQAELLTYTLGFILLNAGLAIYLHLSVLLASMFLGGVLVNIDRESSKFFNSLNSIDSPLYLIFFVLAGASLEIAVLPKLGMIGLVYIVFRSLGKIWGASIGAKIANAGHSVRKYLGLALLPQAGVALGTALIAKATFPEIGGIIITTIVTTSIIYELFGPLCTKFALKKAGEIGAKQE